MPNSLRAVLSLLAVAVVAACSPAPEGTPTAESPAAAPPAAMLQRPPMRAMRGDVEWPFYGGNLASQRYSPLDQIDAGNAGQLKIAWRFNTGNYGPRPEARNETTPLMIDGVLYTHGGHHAQRRRDRRRRAASCLWVWRPNDGEQRFARAPRKTSGRGLAYWSDGAGNERVVHRDAGLLSRGARSRHRPAGAGLRRERHRRPAWSACAARPTTSRASATARRRS